MNLDPLWLGAIAGLSVSVGLGALLIAFLIAGKRADERDEALVWRIKHGDVPRVPKALLPVHESVDSTK